jgi:hypothetical protein
MTPRFFFHDDLGARMLESSTRLQIDLFKDTDGDLHVSFEASGNLTPRRTLDDIAEGDLLTTEDRDENNARAIDLAGRIVKAFAANAKGGGE